MSVDGLWTVEFYSTLSIAGKGVVVLTNGQILGGDNSYWYSGNYIKEDNSVKGKINVTRFDPNAISIFGNLDHFSLEISVITDDNSMDGSAFIVGTPDFKMGFKGTKKADL